MLHPQQIAKPTPMVPLDKLAQITQRFEFLKVSRTQPRHAQNLCGIKNQRQLRGRSSRCNNPLRNL
jgi:hypothetical protein